MWQHCAQYRHQQAYPRWRPDSDPTKDPLFCDNPADVLSLRGPIVLSPPDRRAASVSRTGFRGFPRRCPVHVWGLGWQRNGLHTRPCRSSSNPQLCGWQLSFRGAETYMKRCDRPTGTSIAIPLPTTGWISQRKFCYAVTP